MSSSPDYSFLAEFQNPIKRSRPALLYQFSLILVTFAMLLLPVIYLGLAAAAGYAVGYHAVHHWKPIMEWGGVHGIRILILKFLVYFIPLFAGAVIVFFMFKPIFARRPKHAQPLALNPMDNPMLYALIEKICNTVGAASPKRIDLDCQLNASAGFRRGFLSMARKDMVLTIGLPLVANLTAREFAGVVAHEFGHFTQGLGMRLSYVINRINVWFARVVYQRDAWDVALEQWSMEEDNGYVVFIIGTTQIGVWFSRLILRVLMYTGFFLSGFMSRQMEYHADTCQIKVVGSEVFELTHHKLATLQAAMEATYKQIHGVWSRTHQLPDNLCELTRQAHENLPPGIMKNIENTLGLQRTGWFDTHPSPADRIRRARQAADPGIFHDDRPASSLFASFDHPARFVTLVHYTDDLGIPIAPAMLLHVESKAAVVESAPKVASTGNEACDEYFLGVLPLMTPLRLQPPAASTNLEGDAAELEQLQTGLEQVAEQLQPLSEQYAERTQRLISARAALRLRSNDVLFKPELLGFTEMNLDIARTAETDALAARESLRHSVHEVTTALTRRLELGLALATVQLTPGEDGLSMEKASELVTAVNLAAESFPDWRTLSQELGVLEKMRSVRDAQGEVPALTRALTEQMELVRSLFAKLHPAAAPDEPAPAGRLRISRREPANRGADQFTTLRQQTYEWLTNYYSRIEELVRAARSVERFHA